MSAEIPYTVVIHNCEILKYTVSAGSPEEAETKAQAICIRGIEPGKVIGGHVRVVSGHTQKDLK